MQLHGRLDEIRALGAELVAVGSGQPWQAAAFREDAGLDILLLCDPELEAYRAARLRRGRKEIFNPKLALNAARALRSGHRQQSVQGDAFQLGGVLVIDSGGRVLFEQRSRVAGDHADPEQVIRALRGAHAGRASSGG